jgi:hypothetical protein
MAIYEALIYVRTDQLEVFAGALLNFVERSLSGRAIDLNNTLVLLGNLARGGNERALALLRSLTNDTDPGIGDNASHILRNLPQK